MSKRNLWGCWVILWVGVACGGGSKSADFNDDTDSSGGSGGSSSSGGSSTATSSGGSTGGTSSGSGTGGTVAGTGGTATGGTGGGVDLEDLPTTYADAFCDIMERCSPLFLALLSPEQCRDYFTNVLVNQGFADMVDAIEAGRVSYDGVKMQACIDEVGARECDELDAGDPESCEQALVGSVARGSECTTDVECEGDSICDFNDSCPGICSARLNAGEACFSDDQCEDGLICADETGRCVAPAAEGDACGGGVAPDCDGARLFCLGDDDDEQIAGTCLYHDDVFTAEPGDPCDFDEGPLCVEGSACAILDYDAENNQVQFECVPVVEVGEPCFFGALNACRPGHFCAEVDLAQLDFEGTCQPIRAEGDACDPDVFGMCGFGALCLSSGSGSARCVGKKANGVSCDADDECWSEHCVDGGCAPTSTCDD